MGKHSSFLKQLKEKILHALPFNISKKLYLIRNYGEQLTGEVLENLEITLEINHRDKLWQKRFSEKEGHEIGLCKWLQKNLKDHEVFFDVGSCYGFFPALVSTLAPNAKIYAFEASPFLSIFLKNNASRYKTDNYWHVINAFVGNQDNSKTIQLDTLAAQEKIVPTLIKIDVDGAEYQVLEGAKGLIENRKTEFLIEIHPKMLPSFGSNVEEVLNLFPKDYTMKILTQIRKENEAWSEDMSQLNHDDNPYIYVAPQENARF